MAVVRITGDGDDGFPADMPILAVGHNPTCLKVLTGRLRSCKYHVTPVKETNEAMRLLRENKDKFALVIIDVDMPDMDAFKLLECVGKETDLPFIILSTCNDIERVKSWIDHGACDHLSKPVPMEQLKNIWHHVFRRNRLDRNKESTSSSGTLHRHEEDVNCNLNPCKRKQEANNAETEEVEGTEQQSGYSSTRKKPRVVWTPELHSKFLEAVDNLGLDKAVPKKILELMNDPRLKRENVASHLQKYRLYVKKSTKCKANMVGPVGNNDSAYRGDGVVAVQNVGPVGQHSVNAYRSHPIGLAVPSSEIIPWGQSNISISSRNHHPHMFPQMPMNLAPLTDGTADFSKLHIDPGRYRGGFGNNVDNRHDHDTSGDMRGIMLLDSARQVFVNQPNDGESFLDSAFHTLPNLKTTYLLSQTQPVSHDNSDNDLHQQTFFRGDPSGLIANGISYEGHEFHTNDEVTDSDLGNSLWQPGHPN